MTVYTYEPRIEILSIRDERLKTLGEALSNDTSRAILGCIMEGNTTAAQIASALNLSLPLVVYHLERLLKTNIIKIADVELNSKGRDRKIYGAKKIAIFIQLKPDDPNLTQRLQKLFVVSVTVTAIGVAAAIWQAANAQNGVQMVVTDPEDTLNPIRTFIPIIVSSIGGSVSAALAWTIRSLKRHT